jgi:hypothetical protein
MIRIAGADEQEAHAGETRLDSLQAGRNRSISLFPQQISADAVKRKKMVRSHT